MLISQGFDPAKRLPYVLQDVGGVTETRYLGKLPIPTGHRMSALPTYGSYLRSAGLGVIPRSDWPKYQFERRHTEVPILDQDGHGACVGYAHTTAGMLARSRAGSPFVLLGADFLYTLINGGVDMGANGADAVAAMQQTGICPASCYTGRPIRPAGVDQNCVTQAARFRLIAAFRAASVEEAVTAVIMGWQLTFAVQAGDLYDTTKDGTVAYCGPALNHEQTCGEGLRVVGGRAQVLGRNSWNITWGQEGFGWFQEAHLAASDELWVIQELTDDPQNRPFTPFN